MIKLTSALKTLALITLPCMAMAAPPSATISDMQWLVGKWHRKTVIGTMYEHWSLMNDSTMAGVSGLMKKNDTAVWETIAIEQRGGELYYVPTVKDQNDGKPVRFKLVKATGGSFIFSNPGHDFPDKITYTQKSPTSLLAKISGKKKSGKVREEEFPFERVE